MGHNLLKGKKGIIFGALDEKSIAWKVALKAHEEGATFVLTNTAIALRLGTINQLAEACNASIIPSDVTIVEELETLFGKSVDLVEEEAIRNPYRRASILRGKKILYAA